MATKTYPYSVIWNGEIVPANTPIEVKEAVTAETAEAPDDKAKKSGKRGVK